MRRLITAWKNRMKHLAVALLRVWQEGVRRLHDNLDRMHRHTEGMLLAERKEAEHAEQLQAAGHAHVDAVITPMSVAIDAAQSRVELLKLSVAEAFLRRSVGALRMVVRQHLQDALMSWTRNAFVSRTDKLQGALDDAQHRLFQTEAELVQAVRDLSENQGALDAIEYMAAKLMAAAEAGGGNAPPA